MGHIAHLLRSDSQMLKENVHLTFFGHEKLKKNPCKYMCQFQSFHANF